MRYKKAVRREFTQYCIHPISISAFLSLICVAEIILLERLFGYTFIVQGVGLEIHTNYQRLQQERLASDSVVGHRETNLTEWLAAEYRLQLQITAESATKSPLPWSSATPLSLPHQQIQYYHRNKRLAIIIPFRDSQDPRSQGVGREQNLKDWLDYMADYLSADDNDRHSNNLLRETHVFVVEQCQEGIFNKGFLFNVGFVYAMKIRDDGQRDNHLGASQRFDYMVFHDVDQIPTQNCRNCYAFQPQPTKLIRSTTRQDPQTGLMEYRKLNNGNVGGALLMTPKHYLLANGYSNRLAGWGREDDNMAVRINRYSEKYKVHPVGTFRGLAHDRVLGLDESEQFENNVKNGKEVSTGLSDLGFEIQNVVDFAVKGLQVTRVSVQPILPEYGT